MKDDKTTITRRKFILGLAVTTAGVSISLVPSINSIAKALTDKKSDLTSFIPSLWVTIDTDNTITITNSRQEMGQGSRTTMAQILSEELNADWSKVKVVQAPGDAKYGSQGTGGSQSVRTMYTTLRNAGATAKAMMITAAAQIWGISEANCKAENSFVLEVNGSRKLSYGELADKASTLPVPSGVPLKNPKDFTIIGQNKMHVDNSDIISGKAIYGMDVKLPGMKYAVVVRPPAFGASLTSYTDTEALKVPGVIKTLRINYGVAVIADNSWAAMRGADKLSINWNLGNNKNYNSSDIFTSMYNKIGALGDISGATKVIESTYEVPYMAHNTMEPQTATAWFHDGKMDVYASTQDPQSVRSSAASASGVSSANVNSYPMLAGGGFGRRLGADYASIAAAIAKQVTYPVKMFFTKTDDLQHDNYRPASVHALKGGVDANGNIVGWIHKGIGASPTTPPYKVTSPKNSSDSGLNFVPTGAWRSVDNTQVIFANESFIDELAFAAGIEPFDFRLRHVNNNTLKNCLTQLRTKSNWDDKLPEGWGKGVSAFSGYGSYIAHAIFVSVSKTGQLKVEKIVAVVDPGTAINPKNIEAQVMGAAIDGLSTGIKAEITIENGGVKQTNWYDFEWLRINESPIIEAHVIPTGFSPGGMGEVGFPSVTPALCNAIFNATGIRVKKLPISKTPLVADIENMQGNNSELSIYPNPSNSSITISLKANFNSVASMQLEILNILGTKVMNINRANIQTQEINEKINISDLPDGVYFAKLSIDNKQYSGRFIKK